MLTCKEHGVHVEKSRTVPSLAEGSRVLPLAGAKDGIGIKIPRQVE